MLILGSICLKNPNEEDSLCGGHTGAVILTIVGSVIIGLNVVTCCCVILCLCVFGFGVVSLSVLDRNKRSYESV